MAYVYLAAAIIFEIFSTISMKYAEGFTKVVPSILMIVCSGICFVCLAVTLKTLPVSLVYAIWAGVGTAVMAVVGLLIFNEPLPLQKVVATTLIILGVVMLNLSSRSSQSAEERVAENVESVKSSERTPAVNTMDPTPHVIQLTDRHSG